MKCAEHARNIQTFLIISSDRPQTHFTAKTQKHPISPQFPQIRLHYRPKVERSSPRQYPSTPQIPSYRLYPNFTQNSPQKVVPGGPQQGEEAKKRSGRPTPNQSYHQKKINPQHLNPKTPFPTQFQGFTTPYPHF
jgi:hypothetical protein